jgi:cell division protein FtsI (penicillin-binding protein 3)
VAAPVFTRIAQQVLAYMNVPHDIDIEDSHRLQLLARNSKQDTGEAAPDHIGEEPEPANSTDGTGSKSIDETPTAEVASEPVTARIGPPAANTNAVMVPASIPAPPSGTVVLDVVGGVEVPDFRGKPLRTALEEAEAAGIELEVSGSGVGLEQSPVAGSRVPPGGHVMVKFGR